jgi:hypothetical protein
MPSQDFHFAFPLDRFHPQPPPLAPDLSKFFTSRCHKLVGGQLLLLFGSATGLDRTLACWSAGFAAPPSS